METTLRVAHEMVLSEDLKYTKYNTDSAKNLIEIQTLEKSFVRYSASSLDSSSITWNLPSISGGAITRELEIEIPINFTITFRGVEPDVAIGGLDVNVGQAMLDIVHGTSPRPFMTEMNCLDMFPLSKIFNSREYTINNSSTILKEDFTPEQIDVMIAQGDMTKIHNAGVQPFADANAHFSSLADTFGGLIQPISWYDSANANNSVSTIIQALGAQDGTTAGFSSAIAPYVYFPECVDPSYTCDSWAAKRNRARNIVSSSVVITPVTGGAINVGVAPGCGDNQVPTREGSNGVQVALYDNTRDWKCDFTIVVREQLWSQFFDHEYSYNRFQWNRLLPASSLNFKFNINAKYMQEAVLKIGDNITSWLVGGATYNISTPTIGPTNSCVLYVHQAKVPLALLPRQSYKVLYYAQDRPQAKKGLSANAADETFTASMQYANLSQIPEYLLIYLPVNKVAFQSTLPAVSTSLYQLPSVMNLPITGLTLTFNQDTGLGTHGLDMYTLQKYTMENLQNLEALRGLVVGEGCCTYKAVPNNQEVLNNTGGPLTTQAALNGGIVNSINQVLGSWKGGKKSYNGISNSSFVMLKLGSQIRLPEGYAPGMIVNYNLEVTTTCDLRNAQLKRAYGDMANDVANLKSYVAALTSNTIPGELDVVHFNKRIFTLSGDAMQNLYVHNVQITSAEFLALRNQFQSNFATMSKDDVFDSRMMIGGGMFSNIKDKAVSVLNSIAPRIRQAVELAKKVAPEGSTARRYVDYADEALGMVGKGSYHGGMEDPHAVEGAARGRKPAPKAKVSKTDWRKYLADLQ